MKIYEREYDNKFLKDGVTLKDNKLLGDFEIIKIVFEDYYESVKIGKEKGKVYMIIEKEVSGYNGGSKFVIEELDIS
jgi:hypothetical protein